MNLGEWRDKTKTYDFEREVRATFEGRTFDVVGYELSSAEGYPITLDLVERPNVPTKAEAWNEVCYYVRRIDSCGPTQTAERSIFEDGLLHSLDSWKDAV